MTTYTVTNATVNTTTIKTAQIRALCAILADHVGNHDSESMSKLLADNRLTTRQDPYLIFKYYQRDLVKLGILRIEKTSAPAKMRGEKYWNYEYAETPAAIVEVLEFVE